MDPVQPNPYINRVKKCQSKTQVRLVSVWQVSLRNHPQIMTGAIALKTEQRGAFNSWMGRYGGLILNA